MDNLPWADRGQFHLSANMADGVDIDLYDNIEDEFNPVRNNLFSITSCFWYSIIEGFRRTIISGCITHVCFSISKLYKRLGDSMNLMKTRHCHCRHWWRQSIFSVASTLSDSEGYVIISRWSCWMYLLCFSLLSILNLRRIMKMILEQQVKVLFFKQTLFHSKAAYTQVHIYRNKVTWSKLDDSNCRSLKRTTGSDVELNWMHGQAIYSLYTKVTELLEGTGIMVIGLDKSTTF